ncbi:hypothetical protein FKP32DRAFT_717826 [Trametes sanguinea]|nr:hypothetical protein FKP32DRAFT_717826 [Trametes sanguinea]
MSFPWDPPTQCSDPDYAWLQNSAGQSACALFEAFEGPCLASIGNRRPLDSTTCLCSTVPYSMLYACGLCSDRKDLQITFGFYSGESDCVNTAPPGQYLGQTFDVNIPSWAYQQLTASDSFDVAKAEQVAGESSSPTIDTQSPKPPGTSASSTPSEPSLRSNVQHALDSEVLPSSSSLTTRSVSDTTAVGRRPVSTSNGPVGESLSVGGGDGSSNLPANGSGSTKGGSPESTTVVTSLLLGSFTVISSETYWQTQTQTQISSPSPTSADPKHHDAPIAGAVSASVIALLAILVVAVVFYCRRRRGRAETISEMPIQRAASQASIASARMGACAASVASVPPHSVIDIRSTEDPSHSMEKSSPAAQMRLYVPPDLRAFPPSLSEIAGASQYSESSPPPYSP